MYFGMTKRDLKLYWKSVNKDLGPIVATTRVGVAAIGAAVFGALGFEDVSVEEAKKDLGKDS